MRRSQEAYIAQDLEERQQRFKSFLPHHPGTHPGAHPGAHPGLTISREDVWDKTEMPGPFPEEKVFHKILEVPSWECPIKFSVCPHLYRWAKCGLGMGVQCGGSAGGSYCLHPPST